MERGPPEADIRLFPTFHRSSIPTFQVEVIDKPTARGEGINKVVTFGEN
jgi:hypothetical protein